MRTFRVKRHARSVMSSLIATNERVLHRMVGALLAASAATGLVCTTALALG